MDFILALLKFAGILVGGVSGVLGTITKTHDEKTIAPLVYGGTPRVERKLTVWGKVSLTLTIFGALVACGAQLAENWKKQQEDDDSRKRTAQQIKQANDLLKQVDDQSRQSATILTNVEIQNRLSKQSLDTLSLQSRQTAAILTNVEHQGKMAKQSLDVLTNQALQTAMVLTNLEVQGTLAQEQLKRTHEQNELSLSALTGIKRLVTPINNMNVQITYAFPSNSATKPLVDAMKRISREVVANAKSNHLEKAISLPPVTKDEINGALSNNWFISHSVHTYGRGETRRGRPLHIYPEVDIETNAKRRKGIETKSQTIHARLRLPEDGQIARLFVKEFPELTKFDLWQLTHPNVIVKAEITNDYSTLVNMRENPISRLVETSLLLDMKTETLKVAWTFWLDGFFWQVSHRKASVLDVSGVRLYVSSYQPFYNLGHLVPSRAQLKFEKDTLASDVFTRVFHPRGPHSGFTYGPMSFDEITHRSEALVFDVEPGSSVRTSLGFTEEAKAEQ